MPLQKILIVEDEALVARHVQRRLEQLDYQVPQVVMSGEEAVALAQADPPDLILMDIRLSGPMDGVETMQAICQQVHRPHIYITAHADDETIERAKQTRPAGYLLKPIDMHQLQVAIQMALYLDEVYQRTRHFEQRYEAMRSITLDGFLELDTSGRLLDANPAYCRMSGYTRDELLKSRWLDLETSHHWGNIACCIEAAPVRYESIHRSRDEKSLPVEVSLTYLPDQELLFIFLRDISGRKRA